MIDIIARNKGTCTVSLELIDNRKTSQRNKTDISSKSIDNIHEIKYSNGEVRVNGLYLFDKIVAMKPEKMLFNMREDNHGSILKLASIPTVYSLHFSFTIDDHVYQSSINIYRLLVCLRFIDDDMSHDEIMRYYQADSIELSADRANKHIIKSITYDLESKFSTDEDYYHFLLSSTMIEPDNEPYTFPDLKVLSIPVNKSDYQQWCDMLPNVSKFTLTESFLISEAKKRNEELMKEVNFNQEFIQSAERKISNLTFVKI